MENENQQNENGLGAPELPPLDGQHIPAGEPDGQGGPAPDQLYATAAMIAGLTTTACSIIAARLGDHWNVTPEEAQAVGGAAAPVVEKYFPGFQSSPELNLILVLGGVFGLKYLTHRAIVKAREEAEKKAKAAADGQQSGPN